jgi:hypothetical protein
MFYVEASYQGYPQGPDAMFRLRAGCAVSRVVSDLASTFYVSVPRQWGDYRCNRRHHIAAAAGRSVFPHVFCPIHAHLACAFPNVETVELIPEESRADPLHRLLCNVPAAREGKMSPGSETEIGISIDWEAVEKPSRRHVVIARKLTQVRPPMLDQISWNRHELLKGWALS